MRTIKSFLVILSILFSLYGNIVCAQKNTGSDINQTESSSYFNITKINFSLSTKIRQELFIPNEGNIFKDIDSNGSSSWSFQTINGFFLSSNFSLGLGIGYEKHNTPEFSIIPIFIDARLYLSEDEESLFSFVDLGPTIGNNNPNPKFNKGVFLNLGIGYKYKLTSKLVGVSEVFFSHRTVSLTNEGIGTSDDLIKVNGFGLSLGLMF